jgi:alanine racemase
LTEAGGAGSLLRRAWVEIDLGALARNFERVAAAVAPARVLPVVKADGYGHGAVAVARALEPMGAGGFAVALVEEGVELRRAGIRAPVLVLSPTPAGAEGELFEFDLVPAVSGPDQLDRLEAEARARGRKIALHLKFDTGMTRLGLAAAEAPEILSRVRRSDLLELTGLMSHLAEADRAASPSNQRQIDRFRELLAALDGAGFDAAQRAGIAVHLANSDGALRLPRTRHDLVRIGLALYGAGPRGLDLGLEPVMAVRAELVQVREIAAGTRAGYGGRWTAQRPSRVGVVPVGYADGYPWRAEGSAEALIRGRRAPLAGAVSMDLVLLDVTDCGGEVGETVTLLGRDGAERIGADELAERCGTLVYEVLCHFGLRLPRREVGGPGGAAGSAARRGRAAVTEAR